MNSVEYRYKAKVVKWVDGDTVDLYVDLGFYHFVKTRFRLYGIDTPERGHELWSVASDFAKNAAPVDSEVTIEVYKDADKYGRWLVTIRVGDQCVNDALVAAGLAVPYYGSGSKAWNEAVQEGLVAEYIGERPKG
jgi:micrococcal nuclease